MIKLLKDKYALSCCSCGCRSENPNDFSYINFEKECGNAISFGPLCKKCRSDLIIKLALDLIED